MDARLRAGEFTVILGPSGCGKSTLLNMIAGLENVSSGRILIGGQEMQDREPKERGCAMVFQNYALYPHMTVADNIGYALKIARVPRPERVRRIAGAAGFVSLDGFLERRPGQLSGGQRQRVAIARAIVREPRVMLFDEPLSNLDAKLRQGMRMELAELHRRIGATTVFVTHDQIEAMTLADRIMVLNDGKIEQFDTPEAVYHQSRTTFVAGFIGSPPMNLLNVTNDGGTLRLASGEAVGQGKGEGPVILGIRPEQIALDADGLPVSVLYHEDLGPYSISVAELPDGQQIQVAASLGKPFPPGATLGVRFPQSQTHLFSPDTGKAIANPRRTN